jgi:hypothetical protein
MLNHSAVIISNYVFVFFLPPISSLVFDSLSTNGITRIWFHINNFRIRSRHHIHHSFPITNFIILIRLSITNFIIRIRFSITTFVFVPCTTHFIIRLRCPTTYFMRRTNSNTTLPQWSSRHKHISKQRKHEKTLKSRYNETTIVKSQFYDAEKVGNTMVKSRNGENSIVFRALNSVLSTFHHRIFDKDVKRSKVRWWKHEIIRTIVVSWFDLSPSNIRLYTIGVSLTRFLTIVISSFHCSKVCMCCNG